MFEKASRMKLRFNYRGKLSVEDLWDLTLAQLDKLYGVLRTEQKAMSDDSLLKKATEESTILNLSVDIVRHVVETKLSEDEARKNRAQAKMRKEKIAAIIEKKKDEGLEAMSLEDLEKAHAEL